MSLPVHAGDRRVQQTTAIPVESSAVPAEVDGVVRSPGRPLDQQTRTFMELRFGRDFGGVRVHTDAAAARSARSIHALAYTVGQHIAFDTGRFSPATHEGRLLLAHELTHVAQQTDAFGGAIRPSIQRQKAPAPTEVRERPGLAIYLTNPDVDNLEAELLRRGILKPGQYDLRRFAGDGYYFAKSSGSGSTSGHVAVLDAPAIRNSAGAIIGFRIISHLPGASQGSQPGPPVPAKDTGWLEEQFLALPEPTKALLKEAAELHPENLDQVLRIAAKIDRLEPEDRQVYKPIAKRLATNLDTFERSIDAYTEFKSNIKAQENSEKKTDASGKEETLQQKLSKTWSRFDESKMAGMTPAQKEGLAREVAAEQSNIQLEHMAAHPGETAVGMAEGMVRVDKTAKQIVEDVQEAADGNKSGYARIAGAAGAYNKYVAAAASVAFVALLFIPGVNVLELTMFGLATAAVTIAGSAAESELRIKAAGEAKTVEDFKSHTAKAAEAQTRIVVAAAMLALTLVAKLVARIPLPGRYQNVGAALRSAQNSLLEKSGVGPAWQSIKSELLTKLRASRQGLPEALTEESKVVVAAAKDVEVMTGEEFVQHLADGDPKLADLDISPEQAKGIQRLAAATPDGANVAEQLRRNALQALRDVPPEAAKRVDNFIKDVDGSVKSVESAKNPDQLKSSIELGNQKFGPENQARRALAEEQSFTKKRRVGARRRALEAQARVDLDKLAAEMEDTQARMAEAKDEYFTAVRKVIALNKKVKGTPAGSDAHTVAQRELDAAEEALAEIKEKDSLAGQWKKAEDLKDQEAKVFASLKLGRPGLWVSTRKKIRDATKMVNGKYIDFKERPIEGKPVYGHVTGREARRLVLEAAEKGMTQEQFNQWVNEHPEWFRLEQADRNLSHADELPGSD
ncbi:hypothetical protein CG723_04025 [Streptomyces sp. CB01635]|uniref:eCIS core domain-containing protein n=1 Tax=unclassified Streptomyces TaxID=2593676 RepID=UPI000C2736F3|nr:DUF4157 domain-containing protein [Streptomyces sp. CB01635]PJN13711.1 hypothetical protein CG723_04025 [Streptomyces sp. CB01635]